MAKKNFDKKEVNDVLNKAIVSEITNNDSIEKDNIINEVEEIKDETILEESLEIDMDKLSQDLEDIKKEIFEETKVKDEVVEENKENKNKTLINRIFGLMWNGQEFDY